MTSFRQNRAILKADLWEEWDSLELDQRNGLPQPPPQKPYPQNVKLIDLTPPDQLTLGKMSVMDAIRRRSSQRSYSGDPILLDELSFLLWATQGVHRILKDSQITLRTVPSAGARHPFETYIFANFVNDLDAGLYRYLAIEHKLLPVKTGDGLAEDVHTGTHQQYVHESAVVFIWTAIPYRSEWRYGPLAHKMIAQDSGHLCQNLYLACESINLGTCAIGAYHQKKMDEILDLDGEDEFTIYVATVGKPA